MTQIPAAQLFSSGPVLASSKLGKESGIEKNKIIEIV